MKPKPAEDPDTQRVSLRSVIERFERIRSLIAGIAIIVTGGVLLLALFLELSTDRVVVDPFLVSTDADLQNAGTVSAPLAHRYASQLRDIVSEARSNYPAELADTSGGQNRLDAPGEYQAFSNAVRYVAEAVGTRVTHIEGHLIVRPDKQLTLNVRVRSPRQGRDTSISEEDEESNIEMLLQRSAVKAMAAIAPVTSAVYLYRTGAESADVIQTAQDMLANGPASDYPWAYTLWGFAKIKDGKMESAITLLKRALAYDPLFTLAHYNLGVAFRKEAYYRKATEAGREHAEGKEKDSAESSKYYQSAVREFDLAAHSRSNKLRADALRNESACLVSLGRYAEALTAIRAALDAYNYYPEAFWQQGQILMRLGRIDEGQRWFERAWLETSSPDEPAMICINLGKELSMAGRYRKAFETLNRCQSLSMDESHQARLKGITDKVADELSKKGGK